MTTTAPDDIVETHAEGAANDREPLLVLEPLREFLAAHGLDAPDDLTAVPFGDGHSNVTFGLSHRRRAAPAAARAAAPQRPRRAARGAAAARAGAGRRPHAARAGGLRRPGGDRRAVLRDGADARRRSSPTRSPTRWTRPSSANAIADELIDALVELHAVDWTRSDWRASASRPATSSASCAASTACGSTTRRARSPSSSRSARGWPTTCPSRRRRRSSTATTGSATRCSPPSAPARLVAILDWEMATIGDPAGRRRLHDAALAPGRRRRRQPLQPAERDRRGPASRPARSWSPATSSARDARCTRSTGT